MTCVQIEHISGQSNDFTQASSCNWHLGQSLKPHFNIRQIPSNAHEYLLYLFYTKFLKNNLPRQSRQLILSSQIQFNVLQKNVYQHIMPSKAIIYVQNSNLLNNHFTVHAKAHLECEGEGKRRLLNERSRELRVI